MPSPFEIYLIDNIFCFYFNLNLNCSKHLNIIMKTNPKLSIVIPVYNEKDTIDEIVRRVQNVKFEKEIIIIDDCSNDGTRDKIKRISGSNIKKLFHEKNKGKGAALRTGFQHVSGDIVIIQDGDML